VSLIYKGDVFLSPDLAEAAKLNPKINTLIDAFKVFWQTGFHPSLASVARMEYGTNISFVGCVPRTVITDTYNLYDGALCAPYCY
jgi:hypothetical protein